MAKPIEMIKDGQRKTVYSVVKEDLLREEGWQRVDELSEKEQKALENQPVAPWPAYNEMTVEQVLRTAATFSTERFWEIIAYEQATKRRKGVLDALQMAEPSLQSEEAEESSEES